MNAMESVWREFSATRVIMWIFFNEIIKVWKVKSKLQRLVRVVGTNEQTNKQTARRVRARARAPRLLLDKNRNDDVAYDDEHNDGDDSLDFEVAPPKHVLELRAMPLERLRAQAKAF